ncbi:MAG: hypothetical protein U0359_01740 [Byssovorax sp.]
MDRSDGALLLGDLALIFPSGRLYDLRARALVRTVALEPLTRPVLVRAGGAELMVEAGLKDVVARELRSGEVRWRTSARWMSGLSIVHAGGRALLSMRGVKKYGAGPTRLLDAATGAEVPEHEIAPALRAGGGRLFGDAENPACFAWVDDASVRIHRASDGAVVATYGAPRTESPSKVTVLPSGHRVTEVTFDFSRRPDAVLFGATEVLVATGARIDACGLDGVARWTWPLPAGTTVLCARQDGDRWLALLRRPDRAVDAVQLDARGLVTAWADCDGIALFGTEVLTATLGLGAVTSARVEATLPGAIVEECARAPGLLTAPKIVIDMLGKIRAASKDKTAATLSIRALAALERDLGRAVPAWAVAVLAAQSRAIEKKWSVSTDRVRALNAEVAEAERAHLAAPKSAFWMPDPKPFPAGLVALGKSATTKRERHPLTRKTITTWWCALGAESYEVLQFVEQRLGYDGEDDASIPAKVDYMIEGPFQPEKVIAPLLEALRAKVPPVLDAAHTEIRLVE